MDAIWKEDTRAWVRKRLALEVLRCIAFNIVRLLRCRVFRSKRNRKHRYRRILELARLALTTRLHPASGFG